MEFNIYSFFETLGLGVFLFYLIRGLMSKINGLEGTIEAQNKTLIVMERRIAETEKIGNIYKNLMSDLPTDLENYKTILSKTKDETIFELKNQNEEIRKKLLDTQKEIESSENTPEIITNHMRILKKLLGKRKSKDRIDREYFLLKISEAGGRSLEKSVQLLYQSQTIEEYLKRNDYTLMIDADYSIINTTFNTRKAPDGNPIFEGFATMPFGKDSPWHAIINNYLYVSSKRLSELKDELSSLKTLN